MNPPLTVLVCALGGEGGGVLAEWLYTAAVKAGHAAQSTSIPGVAQRTGATTYYVEIAAAAGERPPFCLSPVPGGIDLLVSSELLETLRQAGAGMVSERTHVVSATTRALTVAEKMQPGDGRFDAAAATAALQRHAARVQLLDLAALAREADTAMSAVLLGAIAGAARLPLPREAYEEAIRDAGKGVTASLRGFALGLAHTLAPAPPGAAEALTTPATPAAPAPRLPQGRELLALARSRIVAYQDERYGALFDERIARLRAAGAAAAAAGAAGDSGAVVDDAARWLALWMCFDDIVQVARSKLAASRMTRVRREVSAGDADVLKVYEHFRPGVPEIAALLPAPLAARLLAWDRRRIAAGREPFSLPLRIGTHTFTGALALRLAAALKGQRRRGQRFAHEQALIEQWWGAVVAGTREHPALGLELAACGRLVKGYGSTNERGKAFLLHIVRHLAPGGPAARPAAERAAAVRQVRTAALADEAGSALDHTLAELGAPPRSPREQPVRWYRRRPAAAR